MAHGFFSDTGYRMRENIFSMQDNMFANIVTKTKKFYDTTFFNSDSLNVGPDYTRIAEMYFRLDTETVLHHRKLFNFMNFLGAIGGV